MNIKETAFLLAKLKFTIGANRFLYFLQKLWIVGRAFSDKLYAKQSSKKTLGILWMMVGFFGKVLFLFGMFLALFLYTSSEGSPLVGLQLAVWVYCLLGPLVNVCMFTVSSEKYIAAKQLNLDTGSLVKSDLLLYYIPIFLRVFAGMALAAFFAKVDQDFVLGFMLFYIAAKALGEAFHLFFFDKTGIMLTRKLWYTFSVVILSFVPIGYSISYLFRSGKADFTGVDFLTSPLPLLVMGILGAGAAYYLFWGYQSYFPKVKSVITVDQLSAVVLEKAKQDRFKDVEMRVEDLQPEVAAGSHSKLTGYERLNELFFRRHRRQLYKPFRLRMIILAVLLVAASILAVIGARIGIEEDIFDGLSFMFFTSISVFAMYLLNIGEKSCRAFFYNCDLSLLRYGFYRAPDVVLKTFRLRLKKLLGRNLILGLGWIATVTLPMMILGFALDLNFILFAGSVLILAVFFTVYHLFMYYMFQPYTTSLDVKNPFNTTMNVIVYIFSYQMLQISDPGIDFFLFLAGITLVYISVALFFTYKSAPKRFRVK